MKLTNRDHIVSGNGRTAVVKRNEHGIPEISGDSPADLAFGQGWVHACDRQLQALLAKTLTAGRAAEQLAAEPALIEIDRYMRRLNLLPDADAQIKKLEPAVHEQLQAYTDGFNAYLTAHGVVFELRLLGYRAEPWEIKDTLRLGKAMGLIGLADAQGAMEKFIVQMIQHGIDERRLKELFPYLTERIDATLIGKIRLSPPLAPESLAWLSAVPRLIASNNWVIRGARSESGKPLLCSDPHLEVNRLPSIWQELVMRLPDDTIIGSSIPGAPGLPIGRTRRLAWGATYSFMDQIDFRIEECRDGAYRRGSSWKPFTVRREEIRLKKGRPVIETVYENELGPLEGDPNVAGHYLVMCWSAARGCIAEDFNGILGMTTAKSVKEGMALYRRLEANSFNYVLADDSGNIGYQMSGRLFNRPRGASGLVPLPAWDTKYNSAGFVPAAKLPSQYNPASGTIVTANQDLNRFGKAKPINLPMGSYRADRIEQLLKKKSKYSVEDMKAIHYDLYSLQAEAFMKHLRPLLPDTENGRALRDWDCAYTADSTGAMLFESVYHALLRVVFGDGGMGREVVEHLMAETSLFNDYYANFDRILLGKRSAWFNDRPKDELFRRAIDEGLSVPAAPYGKTRKITLAHLLFGGKLPSFLGFDYGPIELPGCRATIPQGQIFRSAGRTTTFSPSYRMIADMATRELHTNLAGGASDRRFSKWYVNDMKNWLGGVYKLLR